MEKRELRVYVRENGYTISEYVAMGKQVSDEVEVDDIPKWAKDAISLLDIVASRKSGNLESVREIPGMIEQYVKGYYWIVIPEGVDYGNDA